MAYSGCCSGCRSNCTDTPADLAGHVAEHEDCGFLSEVDSCLDAGGCWNDKRTFVGLHLDH